MRPAHSLLYAMPLALLTGTLWGQQPEPPPIQPLSTTGVPAGAPETVLLKGALLQVRLNHPEKLANDVNDLVLSFLPERLLPPPLQDMLKTPRPLLTFLGMQGIGKPLTAETFGLVTGMDAKRPVALSLYPSQDRLDTVVSIPMSHPRQLTGMLINLLRARQFQRIRIADDTELYYVTTAHPTFPSTLFVACSKDTAFICTSQQLALALTTAPVASRIAKTDFAARATTAYADSDIVVMLDTTLARQFVPMIEQRFAKLPPQQIAHIRRTIAQGIPPAVKLRLDLRLRYQFGIDGIEQLMDYTECFATATYEVLVSRLLEYATTLEGFVLAADCDGVSQTLKGACFSTTIQPKDARSAIPMDEVSAAVRRLPGTRDLLILRGQAPRKQAPELAAAWCDKLKAKLAGKELSSGKLDAFMAHLKGKEPLQPFDTVAAWTATTPFAHHGLPSPKDADTLSGYIRQLTERASSPAQNITLMPAHSPTMLEDFCRKRVATQKENWQSTRHFTQKVLDRDTVLDRAFRFSSESLDGGVTKLVTEKAFLTRGGFFGYAQHELINRHTIMYRRIDDHVFVVRGSLDPGWLINEQVGQASALPAATTTWLKRTPKQANTVEVIRLMHYIPRVVDYLEALEELLHRDASAFVAKANRDMGAGFMVREKLERLALEMPIYLGSLNRNPQTGEWYATLPGGLAAKRPAIMPAVSALMQAYRQQADQVGGAAFYARTLPGRKEFALVQSTEALALLVKTVVNQAHETYAGPEGRAALMRVLRSPNDAKVKREETVLINPLLGAFRR